MSWTLKKKLDTFAGPGEIKRREVVLDPQVSPEEIKNREVKLGLKVGLLLRQLCLARVRGVMRESEISTYIKKLKKFIPVLYL